MRISRGYRALALRAPVYALSVALGVAVSARILHNPIPETFAWPPVEQDPRRTPWTEMSVDERSRWALLVTAHRLSGEETHATNFSIPSEWPFPNDVEIAFEQSGSSEPRILARVVKSERVCLTTLSGVQEAHGHSDDQTDCHRSSLDERALHFHLPGRTSWPSPSSVGQIARRAWPQHRYDAARSASSSDSGDHEATWSANLLAGARATASIVGDIVIVGTHGLGSLEAFNIGNGKSRWRARLPNWVHQDAVSDGRVVVVGFGDNIGSWRGRAPSGVAAYDVETGRLLWTEFEGNSVMTSPVIRDKEVAYVTAAGVLRIRRLMDGALLRTLRLPGGSIMGPPVLRNDTLIATLDVNNVCAVELAQARALWCTTIPDIEMLGHSAASIFGDTVVISGILPLSESWWLPLPVKERAKGLFAWLAATYPGQVRSQRVLALDMRFGTVLWRSRIFPGVRLVVGHFAGTPVANDSLVLVNLPTADELVGFSRKTGTIKWTAEGGGARGPVLIVGDNIYVTTLDGRMLVYRATDGALHCSIPLPRHYDRAGPALARGLLFLASTEGDLVALPKRYLDTCEVDSVKAAFLRRQ